MKRLLGIALLSVACAPAGAQDASAPETRAATAIVECLIAGLPEDWQRAEMEVKLAKPGDATGTARYLMARGKSGVVKMEPFEPCNARKPMMTLIEARRLLLPRRQGWTGALLTIDREGKFGLKYSYPE